MKKFLIFLTVSLAAFTAFNSRAFAEEQTAVIFTLDETVNMAVSITYDTEEPVISFIKPGGGKAETKAERGDMRVVYYIPNAAPGEWKMVYDKLGNKELDVRCSSYVNNIKIDEFTNGAVVDDVVETKFRVSSEDGGNYNYEIYAVLKTEDGSVNGSKLLTSGEAALNEDVAAEVRVDSLSDYNAYYLRLDVYKVTAGTEAFDSRVSDNSFTVSGNNAAQALRGVRAVVNAGEGVLTLDWTDYAVYCENYFIAVYDADNDAEPFFYSEYANNVTKTDTLIPEGAGVVRVDVYYRYNGLNSRVFSKEISVNGGVDIRLPEGDVVSAAQIEAEYAVLGTVAVTFTQNGVESVIELSGSGSFPITLEPFYNEIEIKYSMSDPDVVYVIKFGVSLDNSAPLLKLPENKTVLTVSDDTYTVAGYTDPGCVVTVNGAVAIVDDSGVFTQSVSLNNGRNVISVESKNQIGNITSQDVIVLKQSGAVGGALLTAENGGGNKRSYIPLIASVIGAVLFAAGILLFSLFYGKTADKRGFIFRFSKIACCVLTAAFAGSLIYCAVNLGKANKTANSEKFYDIAQESVSGAYGILKKAEVLGGLVKLFAALTVIFALITAFLLFGKRLFRLLTAKKPPKS